MSYWLCRSSQNCALLPKYSPSRTGGIGGDGAAAVQNVGDAAGGNADVERQAIGAELASRHFALQEAARMNDRRPDRDH